MVELRLHCPQHAVEPISDALLALDALSVSVADADAHTDQEQALFAEPGMPAPAEGWQRSHLQALFAQEVQARHAGTVLAMQDFFQEAVLLGIDVVEPQDWVRLTQSQFEPVAITDDVWIVPSWHEPLAQARLAIRLDPGLAFGTGTHPTTRMCLRWMALRPPKGERVLDYGCGSGILAIGAARLGASSVDAVDIDDHAIQATHANALANDVALQVGDASLAQGAYQLVVANILAAPLTVLAPLLCAHIAPKGHLLLAGILARQAEAIQAAYAPYLKLVVADQQEGWVLMHGVQS